MRPSENYHFLDLFSSFFFRFAEWPSPKKPSWAGGCFLSKKQKLFLSPQVSEVSYSNPLKYLVQLFVGPATSDVKLNE